MNLLTICFFLGTSLSHCETTDQPVSFGPHIPGEGWTNMHLNGGANIHRCEHANFHSTDKIDCYLYTGIFRDGFE